MKHGPIEAILATSAMKEKLRHFCLKRLPTAMISRKRPFAYRAFIVVVSWGCFGKNAFLAFFHTGRTKVVKRLIALELWLKSVNEDSLFYLVKLITAFCLFPVVTLRELVFKIAFNAGQLRILVAHDDDLFFQFKQGAIDLQKIFLSFDFRGIVLEAFNDVRNGLKRLKSGKESFHGAKATR
nr:MAG TPA: hypothetical protein [Caudoviricetes sp.]